ncbi:O-antigen polymerase [Algoriphagus sp. PAP.12]|uniref:O-antigen polymerase n=1 Tax=Algoriphagus sp. PAP.12 TaxID=2996678 RepID=UPI00227BE2C3|nr:O-antigen polymerase [Algoriphagus sp. PAP.12]
MLKRFSRYFSYLIIGILFLQITDTYKLLLLVFQKKTNVASILTLMICLFFLAFNFSIVKKFLKIRLLFSWFLLIWFFPVTISLIHFLLGNLDGGETIYWLSFFSLFGTLFISSVYVFYKFGSTYFVFVFFLLAYLSIVLSFVLESINYDLFRSILSLSAETEDIAFVRTESNRSIGFYVQSNMAARALCFFSIFLYFSYFSSRKFLHKLVFFITTIALILLTGSRTSLLIFVTIALYFSFYYKQHEQKKSIVIQGLLPSVVLILFFIPIFYLFLKYVSIMLTNYEYSFLSERLDFLISFFESNDSSISDESIEIRIMVINQYLGYIYDSLLLGYGPVKREEFLRLGNFTAASQNQYLEDIFAFGLFYFLFYLKVIVKSIKIKSFYTFGLPMFPFFIFFFVILIFGFSVNYLLINRIVIISMGAFLGIFLRYQQNFRYDI